MAFRSDATNLLTGGGDTNGESDVFLYEMSTGTITRMSINSSSEEAIDGGSFAPVISGNGQFVAFESDAKNLVGVCDPGVSGDCGEFRDVFFRDRGSSCPADFNGDNVVDAVDLTILGGGWGRVEPCTPHVPLDLDQDCRVGLLDQAIVLASMGPCP